MTKKKFKSAKIRHPPYYIPTTISCSYSSLGHLLALCFRVSWSWPLFTFLSTLSLSLPFLSNVTFVSPFQFHYWFSFPNSHLFFLSKLTFVSFPMSQSLFIFLSQICFSFFQSHICFSFSVTYLFHVHCHIFDFSFPMSHL